MHINSPSESNLCLRSLFFRYNSGTGLQSIPLPRALCQETEQECASSVFGIWWSRTLLWFPDLVQSAFWIYSILIDRWEKKAGVKPYGDKSISDTLFTSRSFRYVPEGMKTWQQHARVCHTFPAFVQSRA